MIHGTSNDTANGRGSPDGWNRMANELRLAPIRLRARKIPPTTVTQITPRSKLCGNHDKSRCSMRFISAINRKLSINLSPTNPVNRIAIAKLNPVMAKGEGGGRCALRHSQRPASVNISTRWTSRDRLRKIGNQSVSYGDCAVCDYFPEIGPSIPPAVAAGEGMRVASHHAFQSAHCSGRSFRRT